MKLLLLLSVLFINYQIINGYGELIKKWSERELLVMMNCLRMNSNQYKLNFMNGFKNLENVISYKYYHDQMNLWPLEFNEILGEMAFDHSIDMSVNSDCFTNENCNGTYSFYDRIDNWKCDENIQEHIYKSTTSNNSYKAINRLLCRNQLNCLNDDDPDVGDFRDRVMGKSINYFGSGIAYNSTSSTWYYTMDFSETSCTTTNGSIDKSIISASHTFKYDKDPYGTIHFIANYFNSNHSINSINLYIHSNNQQYVYSLNKLYSSDSVGKSTSNGVYTVTLSSYNPCDYYYFKVATVSGKTQRYPTTGYLIIVDYKNNCSSSSWSLNSNIFNNNNNDNNNNFNYLLNNQNLNLSNEIDQDKSNFKNSYNYQSNNQLRVVNYSTILIIFILISIIILF